MKNYILFYDNGETGVSGCMWFHTKSDPWLMIACLFDSINPTTTLTLVEV